MERHNLGRLCPYMKNCPVYSEELIIERISPFLIKNVFCNRGYKGWKNCKRYALAESGADVPLTATPYSEK